jgi:heat shock protein HtpX
VNNLGAEGTDQRAGERLLGPMPSPRQALALALASLLVSVAFVLLIATVVSIAAWILAAAFTSVPEPDRKWPRLTAWAVIAIPVVALLLAFLLNRGADGRTFYAQKAANRRVSLLLLVVLIGLFVAIGEVIAASLTFDSYWALAGALLAALVGSGAALFAQLGGSGTVLTSAGARRLDPHNRRDSADSARLGDIVDELSIAADISPPALFVIDDPAPNAMAVGTTTSNAAIAVTSGLLRTFDREQLQGVIGHEMAHIRNLDSRYGVYVAILVGLVALVTDGFLRIVLRAWREGLFLRGASASDDSKGAASALAMGVGLGLLLLAVSLVLRLFAPLAAALVQASVSRQREFLADATSVELTRNPTGLARALAAVRDDQQVLRRVNRGNQHLWFESPLDHDADGRWHLLATHPSLDARITRLAQLYPAATTSAATTSTTTGGLPSTGTP